MTTTPQTNLWEGPFGDAYQERNKPDKIEIQKRKEFMRTILIHSIYALRGVFPGSILEIGAGQGPNMCALEEISKDHGIPISLYATELNQKARIALSENAKTVTILDEIPKEPIADLVMTYGVMIHVHPAHIKNLQTQIYNASKRFIMVCEYFSPVTRPIPYRGERDALWLDDYGRLFQENFNLKIVNYGFAWKPVTGLDNVTYWVFEKVPEGIV